MIHRLNNHHKDPEVFDPDRFADDKPRYSVPVSSHPIIQVSEMNVVDICCRLETMIVC